MGRSALCGLLIACVVGGFSLFFELGTSTSLSSHEGYALIPARGMRESGDYIVPRFGGIPRIKKPPLVYWIIDASAMISGRVELLSARVPSALAALLLGGLMTWWAWRWYGPIAASGAMLAQTSSYYVLTYGRKAEVDMLLVLLVAAALGLVVAAPRDESRGRRFGRWVLIWALAAISWLGKFHFAPVMIFGPAIAWILLERRFRLLWGLVNPLGLLLFAVAVLIWPLLVLERLPDAWGIWRAETLGRALGTFGRQPAWYYLPFLVSWTLPWTPFAVMSWPASWKAAWPAPRPNSCDSSDGRSLGARLGQAWRCLVASGDSRERFLWVWLGVTLAIVTIQANKHPHYILPALPVFSLWTGQRFAQLAARARAGKRLVPIAASVVATLSVVAVVALLALVPNLTPDLPDRTVLFLAGGGAASFVAVCWLLSYQRPLTGGVVASGSWIVAFGITCSVLMPAQDDRLGPYQFGREIRETHGPEARIGTYAFWKDAILWYVGEPSFRTQTPEQVAERLTPDQPLWLITRTREVESLRSVGRVRIVDHYEDIPGLPQAELEHYRNMVLVKVTKPTRTARSPGPDARTVR